MALKNAATVLAPAWIMVTPVPSAVAAGHIPVPIVVVREPRRTVRSVAEVSNVWSAAAAERFDRG